MVGDVVIPREEIQGLMEGRLCVNAPPHGTTKLTDWVREHRDSLGRRYTSEMARRVAERQTIGAIVFDSFLKVLSTERWASSESDG